jgi:tripartite-type tricarboxylate transporter receptor subunit TctC
MAGIELTHVPYKGTAAAFTDVLNGQVGVMFASPTFSMPYIKAGRLRPLGMGGPRRQPMMPEVPTFDEAGLSGFDVTCYHGMWFPAGVAAEITRRLQAEVAKALAVPEVRKHLADNGLIPVGSSSEEFAEFLRKDVARQASIAKRIGIEPQ